ncbi:MAG TPA: Gfo/Idh/MocA family oxidoreductase [Amnibacterium sp.]|uniref:Gfo/Idh/MocA family protein n=1 Tax=Amnibacterium sp. TaxID=1872496 RepID=UPI002F959256
MTGVAIVGTGRMAAAHAAAWRTLEPDAEVLAVVSERTARALADAPRARATIDLDAVLADPAVEVVSICTPTDSHVRLALRALDAGKHVLLEKPLASTVEEGEALLRRAAAGPGLLMVAHVVRFFPGYAAVRDLVRRGELGEVAEVRAARLSSDPDRPAWLQDEARSGGLLVDLAVHDFDQLLLLLGPAVRVTSAPVDEGVEAVVEHAGGGRGTVRVGWDLPPERPFETDLEVRGDRGRAHYAFRAGQPPRSELRVETRSSASLTEVDPGDPYAVEVADFLTHVREGSTPVHGAVPDALAALRLGLAARESLLTGRPVDLRR